MSRFSLARRFWNHVITCRKRKQQMSSGVFNAESWFHHKVWHLTALPRSNGCGSNDGVHGWLTCGPLSPRPFASWSRSAGLKYFWMINRLSNSMICVLVNAVRDLRFFFVFCDPDEKMAFIRCAEFSAQKWNKTVNWHGLSKHSFALSFLIEHTQALIIFRKGVWQDLGLIS